MLNETINATNLTGFAYAKEVTLPQILERLKDLVLAPSNNHEMIWMVIPLLIALFLMEFYFGRYKKEELGWNTALGNSLVLIFISIDLARYMYNQYGKEMFIFIAGPQDQLKVLLIALVFIEGMILLFYDFFHFLPKKIAFFFGSSLPVHLQAYLSLAIIYSSDIPFDLITLAAAILLFFALLLFFSLVHSLETGVDEKGRPLPWNEQHPNFAWVRDRYRKIILKVKR